jgi:hypothetical protein
MATVGALSRRSGLPLGMTAKGALPPTTQLPDVRFVQEVRRRAPHPVQSYCRLRRRARLIGQERYEQGYDDCQAHIKSAVGGPTQRR